MTTQANNNPPPAVVPVDEMIEILAGCWEAMSGTPAKGISVDVKRVRVSEAVFTNQVVVYFLERPGGWAADGTWQATLQKAIGRMIVEFKK